MDQLADVPTPAGPTPRELEARGAALRAEGELRCCGMAKDH